MLMKSKEKMQPKAFYNLKDFAELKSLQENYSLVLKELINAPIWLKWGSDSYDAAGACKFLEGDWTICPVFFGNYKPEDLKTGGIDLNLAFEHIPTLTQKFPETTELLKKIPLVNFAAFSRLKPHSQLKPHSHLNPFSLICHLGLIIPPGETCGLMVNNQVHIWKKPGEMIIFNDNLEHSAWNNSDEDRIVLYLDILKKF